MIDFKQINMATIQKYTSPQALKDFDGFLDALPLNVGYNALIAAGIDCLMGMASVWFCAQELEKVSQLHSDLTNVEALQPPVPVLKYAPVSHAILEPLLKKIAATFKGITIIFSGDGAVKVSATDTDYFPQFLAAISYLQRGGKNWKVTTNALCVGSDCPANKLSADLKVDTVLFGAPEVKESKESSDKSVDKK